MACMGDYTEDEIKLIKSVEKETYNKAIEDVQRWLRADGWKLVKELRKAQLNFYPKEVNIHARIITEIGKLKK